MKEKKERKKKERKKKKEKKEREKTERKIEKKERMKKKEKKKKKERQWKQKERWKENKKIIIFPTCTNYADRLGFEAFHNGHCLPFAVCEDINSELVLLPGYHIQHRRAIRLFFIHDTDVFDFLPHGSTLLQTVYTIIIGNIEVNN